jgi:hypothetical protein
VLLVVLLLAGCASVPDRELPDASATAEDVVEVFVGAVDDHDRAAVAGLATPEHVELMSQTWLEAATDVSDLAVGDAVPRSGQGSAAEGYAWVVYVPVSLTVSGGDASMPDGRTAWGYLLARDDASERWLVVDQGMG